MVDPLRGPRIYHNLKEVNDRSYNRSIHLKEVLRGEAYSKVDKPQSIGGKEKPL